MATLWVLAVAAPLFEVLRRNAEFFVAYRATRADVFLFTAVVSGALPAALAVCVWMAGRASRRFGRWLTLGVVALGACALAAQVLNRVNPPLPWHLAGVLAVGAAAAVLYARTAAAGPFVTFLSPALLAIPLFFLLHPSIRTFVSPQPRPATAAPRVESATPIVLVVFDQLPLASLLNPEHRIDPAEFPGFAALARTSTWFRNASTVAELTQWALPPIVTGRYPRPDRLPVAARHPQNIFTFLASSYRMEVIEPLTGLCPPDICTPDRENRWLRAVLMLADAGIVYLHITAPAAAAARLPPLTENWKGFALPADLAARWNIERDRDRRQSLDRFLHLLRRGNPQQTLYFLHALLPHEPYVYLRSGQQYDVGTPVVGVGRGGRWSSDEWPVIQAYQRHLLQVQYVDAYIERLLQRLVSQDMLDRTLLIVTADHGASFRPGKPFKGVDEVTIRDIASVPLFVKLPFQHDARVDDRNVQSIDIVPTIADVLGVHLTWTADGVSAIEPDAPAPPAKLVFHMGAAIRSRLMPGELPPDGDAVARRAALFGRAPAPDYVPLLAPHRDLVGRQAHELPVDQNGKLDIEVDRIQQLISADPGAPVVSSLVTGRVAHGGNGRLALAIAISGRIAATTYTHSGVPGTSDGSWSAFVSPRAWQKGWNSIDVYGVRNAPGGTVLVLGYASARPISSLNLMSASAERDWNVGLVGFYPLEGPERQPFRWTAGEASVTVTPISGSDKPRSLLVGLAMTKPGGTQVNIAINGCTLFDGRVDAAPWYRTFSLRGCRLPDSGAQEARVTIKSDVFRAGPRDRRELGVAVENLRILKEDWPFGPGDLSSSGTRVSLEVVHPPELPAILEGGAVVVVDVVNRGDHAWPAAADADPATSPVQLMMTWQLRGGAGPKSVRRIDLLRTLYPSDNALIPLALDPPDNAALQPRRGEYDVTIAVARDGRPLGGDLRLRVRGR